MHNRSMTKTRTGKTNELKNPRKKTRKWRQNHLTNALNLNAFCSLKRAISFRVFYF